MSPASDKSPDSTAQVAVTGDLDDLRVDARARLRGDWDKPAAADVRIDGTIDAPQGAALIKFMGLDRFVAAASGAGQLKVQVAGPVDNDMTFEMRLSANGLSAQASGSGRYSQDQGVKLAAAVQVKEADLRPLRAGPGTAASLPLQLTSRVAIAGGAVTFDDIDARLAGSGVRGRLAFGDGSPRQIDGTIEADAADVPALMARAIGWPRRASGPDAVWTWSSDTFGTGLLGKFTGQVALKLARADLLPQLSVRGLSANVHLGKDELALEDVAGELGGGPLSGKAGGRLPGRDGRLAGKADGRLSGRIAFRTAENGLTTQAKISLTNADTAALWPSAARSGSLDLTAELEGTGLSPVALVGSLKGSGNIVLTDSQVVGLDPRTFDAVTRAVDQGLPIETGRISDLVGKSLEGQLSLKRAESTMPMPPV